jgi:hypothetical protein
MHAFLIVQGTPLMHTAQQIYKTIEAMAPSERLRLATLILEGLSENAVAALDFSEEWTDEDIRDLSDFAARHGVSIIGEE